MIVEAHAIAGQAQRGDGIQEARGQAAQAAVAERRLDLELLNLIEVVARGGELVLNLVIDTEVDHVVGEQLADQKLGRDVVELFLAVVERASGRALLHELDQQLINTTVIELLERSPKGLLGKISKIDTGHASSCGELTTCQKFKRSPREGIGVASRGKSGRVRTVGWGRARWLLLGKLDFGFRRDAEVGFGPVGKLVLELAGDGTIEHAPSPVAAQGSGGVYACLVAQV